MQYASRVTPKQKQPDTSMGPDCAAGGNGGGTHRYPIHHDMHRGSSSSPRCLSPHCMELKKQHYFQPSPENQQQQHRRTLSSSNSGSPLMYVVSPATPDGSMNPCHRGYPPYRSHASTHSLLSDSASLISAMMEARTYASSPDLSVVGPTWSKRCAPSSLSLSPAVASRDLPLSQAHSPDLQYCRQRPLNSVTAADSYLSQIDLPSNEAPHMKTTSTLLGDTACGGWTSLNFNRGDTMARTPKQQSRGNCRNNLGCVMLPEEVSQPDKLTQSGMPTSSLPVHSGSAGTSRVRGDSPYQRASDEIPSRKQQSTPRRRGPANLMISVGTSSSAEVGGASPCSASTGGADGNTIAQQQHSENNSSALNSSVDKRLTTTAALVSHRHTPTSSVSWPRDAVVLSPFSRGATPSFHPHQRVVVEPPVESIPVMPSKTSPATIPTPRQAGDSTQDGVAADSASETRGSWASPPRPLAFAQHQHSEKGFIDSQSTGTPHQQPQPLHPPPPMPSSPKVLKSPAMFGVIDLSYSRVDASGSKMTKSMSTGAAAIGANTVATTLTPARTSSRAPGVINARVPVSSLPSSSSNTSVISDHHADPTSAATSSSSTTATGTAAAQQHGRSPGSDFTARYGTAIVRMGHSTGRTDSSCSASHCTPSRSRDAATATAPTTAPTTPGYSPCRDTQTPAHTGTIMSQRGTLCAPLSLPPAKSDDDADKTEQQQQRHVVESQKCITSAAPKALVAARVQKSAAAFPIASVDTVRKSERPTQALMLTPDTVLPVAVPEDGARYSSSAATTATRSSSNSRVHPSFSRSLPRSTIAMIMTARKSGSAGAAASGTGRLERVRAVKSATSVPPRNVAAHERGPSEKLTATFPGRSAFAGNVAAQSSAFASTVNIGVLAGARGAHVRQHMNVSSAATSSVFSDVPGASPAFESFSFVSGRTQMQRYIDQWRDRYEEDKSAYKEGGYLTVIPGRIVHSRYVLIQKLGWGEFSTVWLGYDTKHATMGRGLSQAFVAVKIAKCRSSVQEATRYEVSLLRYLEARLPRHAAITNIIDCFDVRGEFGMHTCMVIPLCGPNLLSIIERMKADRSRRTADDLRMIKEIVVSVLISLHELSELNVVHTDIKPENVLCSAVDSKLVSSMEKFCSYNQERSHMISLVEFKESMAQQTTDRLVCLADFGLSALLEPPSSAPFWMSMCGNVDASLLAPLMRCKKNFPVTRSGVMDNQRGTLIQTREYRAPEVLLGLDFTCATDVWSVGCMTFELITGRFLMDPKRSSGPRDMDIEHLAMMMQLLGPLPSEITDIRVRNNDYYDAVVQGTPVPKSGLRPPPEYLHRFVDRNGNFIYASRYHSYPRRNLELELEPYLSFQEARLAASFILSCLHSYDPKQRPSAKKLLGHQWLHGVGVASKGKTSSR